MFIKLRKSHLFCMKNLFIIISEQKHLYYNNLGIS